MSGPPLWVVERGSSKVFLFADGPRGVKAGDQWFVDPQRSAFEASREFWSEVPDIQQLADSALLAQYGLSAEPLSRNVPNRLHFHASTKRPSSSLVGIAHLVGDDGLPALLAHQGIEPNRLD